MTKPRVLLVDDDRDILAIFKEGLESKGFEVVAASNVNSALNHIATEHFDVLLTDLHMPDAGDGFTVVSAMRHTHPHAVTLVLSGYPALQEAMSAILLEADEVLVKPVGIAVITDLIQKKLADPRARMALKKESVASIIGRDELAVIQHWISLVEKNPELTCVNLTYQQRTGHLPELLKDLVRRLSLPPNAQAVISAAALAHGELRRKQGYTVAMVVEESRILQVSIFRTLQNNFSKVDFSTVLLDVMTIADEVDSQLKQSVLRYVPTPSAKSAGLTL